MRQLVHPTKVIADQGDDLYYRVLEFGYFQSVVLFLPPCPYPN